MTYLSKKYDSKTELRLRQKPTKKVGSIEFIELNTNRTNRFLHSRVTYLLRTPFY